MSEPDDEYIVECTKCGEDITERYWKAIKDPPVPLPLAANEQAANEQRVYVECSKGHVASYPVPPGLKHG